jgi:hypothetical protein
VTAFASKVALRVGATIHVWPTIEDGSIGKPGVAKIKAGKSGTPAKHKQHKKPKGK